MKETTFREFYELSEPNYQYSDTEIANWYFHNSNFKVKELATVTGKSVAEIYRIIHKHGIPNRTKTKHGVVINLSKSGLPVSKIAEFTGYTPRNVRYIKKKI